MSIEAYLYKPDGNGPFPLIVYNHGTRGPHAKQEVPFRYIGSMLGEAVSFHRDGTLIRGIAEDVLTDGALRIRLEDGAQISVVAGEVERLRTAQS